MQMHGNIHKKEKIGECRRALYGLVVRYLMGVKEKRSKSNKQTKKRSRTYIGEVVSGHKGMVTATCM